MKISIHPEGYKIIFNFAIFLFLLNGVVAYFTNMLVFYIICSMSIIFFGFILHFFRNPKRIIKKNENTILSPADGKVVIIEKVFEEEVLKKQCWQVSIFMSPVDVHVNRSPISGQINYFHYHKGKYLIASYPKASKENEHTSIGIKNEKCHILVRQIAGAVARRIKYYVKPNQKIEQGEQIGFIKFGSRADLFLSIEEKHKLEIKLGQQVAAGVSVISTITSH